LRSHEKPRNARIGIQTARPHERTTRLQSGRRFAMAALDWSLCPAVESVPGKLSGAWVFRGTRMPVAAVFENLEDGMSIDELVQLYDGLTREQVQAVLEFAAKSLQAPSLAS
jgi:uncharacterized protein (DUF433 family)